MADDARLSEMYRTAAGEVRTDHPGEDVWDSLAVGELGAAEREGLFDHVIACTACAQIYRGLKLLETGAREFDPGVPRAATASARPAAHFWYAGLATAAALVVAFLVPRGPTAGPPPDVVRAPIVSTPVALAPVGDLTSPAPTFRWTSLVGAARHRVELSRADGDPVWTSSELQGSEAAWPKDLRLEAGTYYWRVVAVPDPDRRLSSPVASPLVAFRIP